LFFGVLGLSGVSRFLLGMAKASTPTATKAMVAMMIPVRFMMMCFEQ
jgi:hypothetical protein